LAAQRPWNAFFGRLARESSRPILSQLTNFADAKPFIFQYLASFATGAAAIFRIPFGTFIAILLALTVASGDPLAAENRAFPDRHRNRRPRDLQSLQCEGRRQLFLTIGEKDFFPYLRRTLNGRSS
jgi:hypothetical protein